MALSIINRRLNLQEFKEYVSTYNFGAAPANKIVVHHTWRPTTEQWQGERSIFGLKSYYEGKGWPSGPHLFVAEDGIWLFSPMRQNGIHAGSLNDRSIGIEVVGDYDDKVWSGETKKNALGVIRILCEHLRVPNNQIYFHRDVSPKSCPGHSITKEWLLSELNQFQMTTQITSAPATQIPTSTTEPPKPNDILIPVWAAEAVAFVHQHKLFEIQSQDDVRDAVKFHRLYLLMKKEHG